MGMFRTTWGALKSICVGLFAPFIAAVIANTPASAQQPQSAMATMMTTLP